MGIRKINGVLHRVTTVKGAMRTCAGWAIEHKDAGLAALDAVASVRKSYSGPGYKVRKCSR